MTSTFDEAVLTGLEIPYRIRVEVEASTGESLLYCDLNKTATAVAGDPWVNRLAREPIIKTQTENRPGRFSTSVSSLIFTNDDYIFGKKTEDLTFYDTEYGLPCTLLTWHNAKIRISIGHHVGSVDAWEWVALGVTRCDRILLSGKSGTATMKLTGFERKLIDIPAKDIKRGDKWLANIPISLLVRYIIERAGAGTITIDEDNFDDSISMSAVDKEVSQIGNIPTLTNSGDWNETRDFVCRYQFLGAGNNGNSVYYLGYSIKENGPAYAKWDRITGDWIYWASPVSEARGYEAVFGIQETATDNLRVLLVSNQTESLSAAFSDARNSCMKLVMVYHVSPQEVSSMNDYSIYMLNQCRFRPFSWSSGNYKNYCTSDELSQYPLSGMGAFFESVPATPTAPKFRLHTRTELDSNETPLMSVDPRYVFDIPTAMGPSIIEAVHGKGYYGYQAKYQSYQFPNRDYPMISYAHTAAHESFKYCPVRGKIYWIVADDDHQGSDGDDEGTFNWILRGLDVSSWTVSSQVLQFDDTTSEYADERYWRNNITAFDLMSNSETTGYLWVAIENHGYSAALEAYGNPLRSRIKRFSFTNSATLTDGGYSMLETEYDYARRWAPSIISIRHTDGASGNTGLPLIGCVMNRYAAQGICYGLYYTDDTGSNEGVYNVPDLCNMPQSGLPFEIIREAHSENLVRNFYAQDQSTGQLWNLRTSTYGGLWVDMIAEGSAVDAESTWASANLLWDDDYADGTLYGVSAFQSPANCRIPLRTQTHWDGTVPQIGAAAPAGRSSLWQWSTEITDVLPLADFTDMNVWDALEAVRMVCGDFVHGFNTNGEFYFKERPTTGVITNAILERGVSPIKSSYIAAESIETHLDYENIVNSLTIPLWHAQQDLPQVTLTIRPDSKADSSLAVTAHQISSAARRVVLTCISDGFVADSAFTPDTPPLLFSWAIVNSDLSTSLSVVASSDAAQVVVYGLYEASGGITRLGDTVIGVGDDLQVGSGSIRKITAIWPESNQIDLDGTIDGETSHPIGTAVRITPRTGTRYSNTEDGVCTVTYEHTLGFNTELEVNDTSLLSPGMVLFADTGWLKVEQVLSSTYIVIGESACGTGTGGNTVLAVGTVLKAALWISAAGRAYSIGNTGVSISISARSSDLSNIRGFSAGDRISISGAGLALKEIPGSYGQSGNAASIKLYGVKEWNPRVDSRLMTPARRRAFLESSETLAFPHWHTTATGLPLLIDTQIGDLFTVVQPQLWPDLPGGITHAVIGITRKLKSGSMDLVLRSTESTDGAIGEITESTSVPSAADPHSPHVRRR